VPSHPGQEQFPGVREVHPAGGAGQQRGAELGLQRADLGRDGGLGQVQVLRRPGEAAAADHGLEGGQLAQLHVD
jgi:hypothetical protein